MMRCLMRESMHKKRCAVVAHLRSLKPADRGGINVVSPRHISLRFAGGEALDGLLTLMRSKLARSAKFHAASLRSLPPLTSPSTD